MKIVPMTYSDNFRVQNNRSNKFNQNFGKLTITEKGGELLKKYYIHNTFQVENLEKLAQKIENSKYWDFVIDEDGEKIVSKKQDGLVITEPFRFDWRYLQNSIVLKNSKLGDGYVVYCSKPNESGNLLRALQVADSRLEKFLLLTDALEKSEAIKEKTNLKKENLDKLHERERLILEDKLQKLLDKYSV